MNAWYHSAPLMQQRQWHPQHPLCESCAYMGIRCVDIAMLDKVPQAQQEQFSFEGPQQLHGSNSWLGDLRGIYSGGALIASGP